MRVLAMGLLAGLLWTHVVSVINTSQIRNELAVEFDSPPRAAAAWVRPPSEMWLIHAQLVSKIRGMEVENRDGQHLGQVQDFLLDPVSGEVRYVVISFGGWLGVGKRLRAVPAKIVSTATAKVGVVSVDAGRRRWQRAAVLDGDGLKRLQSDPAFAKYLDEYFLAPRDRRNLSSLPLPPAKQKTSKPNNNPRLFSSTELVGDEVHDSADQGVGKITDLLIDLTDLRPSLLIFQLTKNFKTAAYAVDLGAFKRTKPGLLVLDVAKEALSRAPVLNDSVWQRPEIRPVVNIYKYPQNGATTEPHSSAVPKKSPDKGLAAVLIPGQ
jgi:sporulation protein YlmC with PRC-barrel domain